jgi:hypothetical protein
MIDELINNFSPDDHKSADSAAILAMMEQALAAPIDHPSLAESIFPGDRIGILLQHKLPCAREALRALISVLEASKVETSDILIVVPASMQSTLSLTMVPDSDADLPAVAAVWQMSDDDRDVPLRFEIHDTENEHAVAYLALNEQGDPIYVNRSLSDCDVVLPLSCLSPDGKQGDCLYPEFSSLENKDRFRKKDGTKKERNAETQSANNSLGLFFSIELVCEPGGEIRQIICGARESTRETALKSLSQLWQLDEVPDCDMVVLTVESGDSKSWASVMQAASNATTLAPGEGPIVIWSELNESPNAKVRDACAAQFEGSVPAKLPARYQRFASILFERPVYLKSALSQNTVENLGLGYVDSADSVARIASSFENPILIRDAHLRTVPDQQEASI